MMDWIAEIVAQGIRRPGYPADQWAERWVTRPVHRLRTGERHARPRAGEALAAAAVHSGSLSHRRTGAHHVTALLCPPLLEARGHSKRASPFRPAASPGRIAVVDNHVPRAAADGHALLRLAHLRSRRRVRLARADLPFSARLPGRDGAVDRGRRRRVHRHHRRAAVGDRTSTTCPTTPRSARSPASGSARRTASG